MSLPTAATATKHYILAVYRNCLKSALRIPAASQRDMYLQYTRDGFRGRRGLYAGEAAATRALCDAEEQLERMNYYHGIREQKEQEQQAAAAVSGGSLKAGTMTTTTETLESTNGAPDESNDRQQLVASWLRHALPDLSNEDATSYSHELVASGFDSLELLQHDLLEEDLNFMKVAHKRAILRVYQLNVIIE